jgi:hypothetical protein
VAAHAAHQLLDERDVGLGFEAEIEHGWTGPKTVTVRDG